MNILCTEFVYYETSRQLTMCPSYPSDKWLDIRSAHFTEHVLKILISQLIKKNAVNMEQWLQIFTQKIPAVCGYFCDNVSRNFSYILSAGIPSNFGWFLKHFLNYLSSNQVCKQSCRQIHAAACAVTQNQNAERHVKKTATN